MSRKRTFEMTIEVLRKQYPDMIIQTNFSKRIRANIIDILRTRQIFEPKQLPDIFIAEPRNGFHGLFVEIKNKAIPGRKNVDPGEYVNRGGKMAGIIERLRHRGFLAMYGFGYTNTIGIIEEYLRGNYKRTDSGETENLSAKIVIFE